MSAKKRPTGTPRPRRLGSTQNSGYATPDKPAIEPGCPSIDGDGNECLLDRNHTQPPYSTKHRAAVDDEIVAWR